MIISEIAQAISRNPKINRVIVPAHEFELLRVEMFDLDPRSSLMRGAWREAALSELHYAKIKIMGREVEARR